MCGHGTQSGSAPTRGFRRGRDLGWGETLLRVALGGGEEGRGYTGLEQSMATGKMFILDISLQNPCRQAVYLNSHFPF